MTCTRCNYQFCWICLGSYSDCHFSWYNIFGCPGGQDIEINNWRLYRVIALLCFIPILALGTALGSIIIVLFLTIGPFFVPTLFCTVILDNDICYNECCCFIKVFFLAIISVILYPISFVIWFFGGSCYFLLLITYSGSS